MIEKLQIKRNAPSGLRKEVIFDGGTITITSYLFRESTLDLYYEKNYIGYISLKNVQRIIWKV